MTSLTSTVLEYQLYTANLEADGIVSPYLILQRTSDGLVSISPNYGYAVGTLVTLYQRVLDTTVFEPLDESVPYTDITLVGAFDSYKSESE